MASILTRFKDIMSSNINSLLDRAEDPAKLVDEYIRQMESDLGKVKAETASVMAEAAKAKRDLNSCEEEIEMMTKYAKRALEAGSEADARTFLEKKKELETKRESLKALSDSADGNAKKVREMHDKLCSDIERLKGKRAEIKSKVAIAETTKKVSAFDKIGTSTGKFESLEEKADRMLDEANAMSELEGGNDDIEDLKAKYSSDVADSDIDAELEALKAELGKTE